MAEEIEVYIKIVGEQGEAWKPVRAVHRGDDIYEIKGSDLSLAPEGWRYSPGDLVRCKPHDLTDSDVVLVAVERFSP